MKKRQFYGSLTIPCAGGPPLAKNYREGDLLSPNRQTQAIYSIFYIHPQS